MSFFSLRTKMIAVMVGLVVVLGLGGTVQAKSDLSAILQEGMERRGVAIGHDLASRSTDLVLTNNIFDLYELINDTLINNDDVRYIFIVDQLGNVRVHTFEKGLPRGLQRANLVRGDEKYSAKVVETEEGPIRDIAVPVFEGRAGTVRLGMSERRIEAAVDEYIKRLLAQLALVAFVGLLGAYSLSTLLTRPIFQLVEAVKAVGKGELGRKANVNTRDEIGKLGAAFDAMSDEIAASRREVEGRNRELSALNTIATTVGQSLDLRQVLDGALDKVLELMKAEAGWLFLVEEDGQGLSLTTHRGLSPEFVREEQDKDTRECICLQVCRAGQAMVMDDVQSCCRIDREVVRKEELSCHASVPLKSKDKVLGIMNVARRDRQGFAPEELGLLSAIGHQVGVAIDNARLYAEVQRKEELRGQLLEKVIVAQEEERKRIARELHDDSAQALTALVMTLEVAETVLPNEYRQLRERLTRTKQLTTEALKEIRKLILDLRPTALDDLGLVPAIRWYAETRLQNAGINFELLAAGFAKRLPPATETALFRVIQEAINNISKHAEAKHVRIELQLDGTSVRGSIQDDGRGFVLAGSFTPKDGGRGLGLLGMQERINLLGGVINMHSDLGSGTLISLEVPLDPQGELIWTRSGS